MLQMILYSMLLMFNFIFASMIHPLAMGLMLLIQTSTICLLTGMMAKTFWFSYILFLIFIGGMLVLFIYVTSLASNEMFSMSMKTTIYSSMFLMIFITLMLIFDKSLMSNFFKNNEMHMINDILSYMPENSLNLNKLYNYPTNMVTILLINYLLITLLVIVKITKLSYGPIRTMN